ncbi:hypothetical protein DA096_15335 [Vibrio rotiferianus]|uniref:hypothetical protein n=1 Tax=Vibrio rotiferianus TaxID=190895 RepID=UPI00111069B7|nr:hypothetical protein [Vibrio rotiferianus]TMX44368.1 hypothetical protein DA095_00785 [Vibrio rotiferianus]TMX48763.1 hypothetical protein DA093_15855 [Vibrio rotiferianus]TMX61989.1 hypothetical protein DA096_15335 [Vibrio rotiferianus]
MKLDQKTLLFVAIGLGAIKYIALPALEQYDSLSEQYRSVSLRYDKSISAIEQSPVYQQKISQYTKATKDLALTFGEPVNIDSYKLELQDKVSAVLLKHGLQEQSFGWKQELNVKVGDIYSGVLSLRYAGDTAAMILATTELESIVKISSVQRFSQTLQGYQNSETDIGRGHTTLEIAIWARAM